MSGPENVVQHDLRLTDGRNLRVHEAGGGAQTGTRRLTLVWQHGSPQTGALLEPLVTAAALRGIHLVSYGRPSYGGSTPDEGRTVASAARDVEQLADALSLGRFAVMGASGGGPHALACAALLPERVVGAVTLAGIAPSVADAGGDGRADGHGRRGGGLDRGGDGLADGERDDRGDGSPADHHGRASDGFDFFAGMADPSGLRAAQRGREARRQHELTAEFDPASFVDRDFAALETSWAALSADVAVAAADGPAGLGGLIDDDVAFAHSWGFELSQVAPPVLLVQGGRDRVVPPAHAEWMLGHLPHAELWLRPSTVTSRCSMPAPSRWTGCWRSPPDAGPGAPPLPAKHRLRKRCVVSPDEARAQLCTDARVTPV